MRITANILYGLLAERYQVSRYGKGVRARELSLPLLYEPGTQVPPGGIYVARTGDLPNHPPENCVFICCGTKPPNVWNMWPCDVLHIADPRVSLVSVFNATLAILDRLVTWESHMQQMAISGAHVREMIEESIPIFDNSMTVSDYELRILGHCEPDESLPGRPVTMTDKFDLVPSGYISATRGFGLELLHSREPYTTQEDADPENGISGASSYCINLYFGDAYVGTCALKEEAHPLRAYDRELFQVFAGYVHDCLGVQSQSTGNQFVSARTVFEQVLQGYPVSMQEMGQATRLMEFGMRGRTLEESKWCCTVMRGLHRSHGLPDAYLCRTVEGILPNTTALVFEDSIVAFSLIGLEEHRTDSICELLEAYLDDMGLVAGVSRTFRDPFHARTYYDQAVRAIEVGFGRDSQRPWYLFGDHVLDYMLQNCCGEFGTEAIVAPELVRLWHSGPSGPEYVRTLKVFLDNDCHPSATSEALFLHRSTLVKRLERIREMVRLDDPDRRLYLRMCLHLPDIEQALEANADAL